MNHRLRDFSELIKTRHGRVWLSSQGVYHHLDDFLDRIKPRPGDDRVSIYAHQQCYLDYGHSVIGKVHALRKVARCHPAVGTDFLWIDTDRAASDKLSLRAYWSAQQQQFPVRFAPPGCERSEPRFIRLQAARVTGGLERLAAFLRQSHDLNKNSLKRLDRYGRCLIESRTLADASRRVTDVMLAEVMNFVPNGICVSNCLQRDSVRVILSQLIKEHGAFVSTLNDRIKQLRQDGIDPALKAYPEDYLPLFYNCPVDDSRIRLRLELNGGHRFAVATSRLGRVYRFSLGSKQAELNELFHDNRVSPDVCLPMLVNDDYSGMLAGQRSGLYMLVLRAVQQSVLSQQPVPVLVVDGKMFSQQPNLVQTYLQGGKLPLDSVDDK